MLPCPVNSSKRMTNLSKSFNNIVTMMELEGGKKETTFMFVSRKAWPLNKDDSLTFLLLRNIFLKCVFSLSESWKMRNRSEAHFTGLNNPPKGLNEGWAEYCPGQRWVTTIIIANIFAKICKNHFVCEKRCQLKWNCEQWELENVVTLCDVPTIWMKQ